MVYQETPLHFAARGGSVRPAACLLRKNANRNAQDRGGRWPLDVATPGVRELLLSDGDGNGNGAKVALREEGDSQNRDPLSGEVADEEKTGTEREKHRDRNGKKAAAVSH